MIQRLALRIACIILLGSSVLLSAQPAPSQFKIVNRFKLGGEGVWDNIAVDEATGRLFVSHGSVVQVVNEKTGDVVGTIPNTRGVHGIAIAADLNKGFTSNGKDSSITIFDLKAYDAIAKVPTTGEDPDAIIYDQFSHRVFCFSGRSTNATVLDARENKLVSTIPLYGKPEAAAVDGKGNLYVNIENKSTICRINTKTLKVEQKWPVAPGNEPTGLAIDVAGNRLFSVCRNKLMIIMNAQTGKVIGSVPIGERADGAGFDPVKKLAYSSNGDGTLTIVQETANGKYTVLETVPTQQGARTMTVDTKSHHLFLPAAEFGPVPKPTAANPKPRPLVKDGSFMILDLEPLN